MHILTKRRLREFWSKHPDAESTLRNWYKYTRKAAWSNLAETRVDFAHADLAGACTIFNIGGNKYRLVTKIFYPAKKVLIRFVLTHEEYNRKPYKNDCEL